MPRTSLARRPHLPNDKAMTAQYPVRLALLLPIATLSTYAAPLAPASAQAPAANSQAWLARMFSLYAAGGDIVPAGAPSSIANSLAQWDLLRRAPKAGTIRPLQMQASFIAEHPDWPGVAAIRRRAEAQATDPLTSDADARAFFARIEPVTVGGMARLALLSDGARGTDLARAAWVRAGLLPEQEQAISARYIGAFTKADHARRADALLWAGQITAADRMLPWLDSDARALTQARSALRRNAADAEALFASVPASVRRNPGLVHDRTLWLERRGRLSEAEALLARGDMDAGNVTAPETWLERRLALGRAAMRRGDNQTAYRLLANHKTYAETTDLAALPLSQRVDLSDTEWLAGWIAMRRLNRADDAARHFNNFRAAVTTPISMSRGDYWLGRAEKQRGNAAAARQAFERAAANFDYFYGQLAAEELGRLPALPDTRAPAIPAEARTRFQNNQLVRAINMLDAMGERERQSLFVRAIASSTTSPIEARLAAEHSRTLGRADLGVWVWKSSRPDGDFGAFEFAYPTLGSNAPVPANSWILSHAIARQESSFDRTAVSGAGARGLMQLMPGTARDVSGKLGLPYNQARLTSDPAYNVTLGSYYIGMRRSNFSNIMMAIAAYNAGAGNVRKWLGMNGDPRTAIDPIDWIEMIPFTETRNYVQRVIENAVVYSLANPKRPDANPRASYWLRAG